MTFASCSGYGVSAVRIAIPLTSHQSGGVLNCAKEAVDGKCFDRRWISFPRCFELLCCFVAVLLVWGKTYFRTCCFYTRTLPPNPAISFSRTSGRGWFWNWFAWAEQNFTEWTKTPCPSGRRVRWRCKIYWSLPRVPVPFTRCGRFGGPVEVN